MWPGTGPEHRRVAERWLPDRRPVQRRDPEHGFTGRRDDQPGPGHGRPGRVRASRCIPTVSGRIALQANTGTRRIRNSDGTGGPVAGNRTMKRYTSPSAVAMPTGGSGSRTRPVTACSIVSPQGDTTSLFLGMSGSSPSLAPVPGTGEWLIAFEADTCMLWRPASSGQAEDLQPGCLSAESSNVCEAPPVSQRGFPSVRPVVAPGPRGAGLEQDHEQHAPRWTFRPSTIATSPTSANTAQSRGARRNRAPGGLRTAGVGHAVEGAAARTGPNRTLAPTRPPSANARS